MAYGQNAPSCDPLKLHKMIIIETDFWHRQTPHSNYEHHFPHVLSINFFSPILTPIFDHYLSESVFINTKVNLSWPHGFVWCRMDKRENDFCCLFRCPTNPMFCTCHRAWSGEMRGEILDFKNVGDKNIIISFIWNIHSGLKIC